MTQFDLITLFPEMFTALNYGIVGRAIRNKLISVNYWNPRDYTQDLHHTVDDRPYGGGPGMVMLYEPLHQAIQDAKKSSSKQTKVIYLSPQGKLLDQTAIQDLVKTPRFILLSGRYEGIDERLIESDVDEEWSIGDYVLSGGEFPAMVLIDALTRLIPGALGDEDSANEDSFSNGLLDCPHYTRPEIIEQRRRVPSILLSGNHNAILRWRLKQSLGRTWQRRQDLLKRRVLSKEEKMLLDEYIQEAKEEL